MSISTGQMVLQVAAELNPSPAGRSSSSPAPSSTTGTAGPPTDKPASASAVSPSTSVTTDLRIDDKHNFYYQFVDGNTGNVVFEIPPEALRAIGESLNLPLNADTSAHGVDVKS